jgi:hypothetical protein
VERSAPATNGFTVSGYYRRLGHGRFKNTECIRIKGRDLYGLVTGTGAAYDDLITLPLNPLTIPGSRLALESALWTKFHFTRVTYRYLPFAGSSTTGAILMSHIADPEMTLPATRQLSYAQSLLTVPGSKIVPLWQTATHSFSPSKEDPKEYYILPDIQGENRFTVQDIFKIASMQSFTGSNGHLLFEWEVILYEPILATSNIVNYSSIPVVTGTSPATNGLSLNDPGAWGALALYFSSSPSGMAVNTFYAGYMNCDFGGIRAFTFFFFQSPATFPLNTNLYENTYDAHNQSSTGKIAGSILGTQILPANATLYFTSSPANSDTLLEKPPSHKHRLVPNTEQRIQPVTPLPESEETELDRLIRLRLKYSESPSVKRRSEEQI